MKTEPPDSGSDILLFSRSHRDAAGGMESVFQVLLKRLRRRGYDAFPVYCNTDYENAKNVRFEEEKEIKLSILRTRNKIPRLRSIKSFFSSLRSIYNVIDKLNPKIVNCHFVDFTSIYFVILKPIFKYKIVLTCHGSDVVQPSSLDRASALLTFRAADRVIGVSSYLLKKAECFAPVKEKSTVIYNGIDLKFWLNTTNRSASPPVIVSVGSLVSVKGHDILIDAFKDVQSHLPGSELLLVGSGSMEESLRKQVASLDLTGNVTFTGWLERREIRQIHERANVFVLPSRSEGLGIALLEAMAAGLPCVATNVGGIPEVINDSTTGTLVPPNDSEALRDALLEILTDREWASRLAKNARQRSKAFSWERALDRYEEVFQDVL